MAVTRNSRVLQEAAYTFDVNVGYIFAAQTHGGCVGVPCDWERAQDLTGDIKHPNVNQARLTSTVANLLTLTDVPKLRKLTLGGEPTSKQCIDPWSGKVALNDVYGPAERTFLVHAPAECFVGDSSVQYGAASVPERGSCIRKVTISSCLSGLWASCSLKAP